ncbi:MAG: hypothetical protein OXG98_12305 [Gemmatimonadetes bacterium]|nr:hypothetical protein [Gemmatimonadota bacterium]
MNIRNIHAFIVDLSRARKAVKSSLQRKGRQPAGPMDRYPEYRGRRGAAGPSWPSAACIVEADDGSFGIGLTQHSGPILPVINEHFRTLLTGQSVMATEKCYDLMVRASAAYGSQGATSYAISAVDLALWDLKGKLLGRPVYELLGGPQKDSIACYATGFDIEWYLELGFKAVKLPMPYGPDDGIDGLNKAVEMVAETRAAIGDGVELMLDCWMAQDVEYAVRLGESLKPYRLKWLEDLLMPQDMSGFAAVRQRLPGQGLATGEHWYLPEPFLYAAEHRLVDIFQPDVKWCGGLSTAVRVCHIAEAAGLTVAPHGAMNDPYGQHLVFAMPAARWGERSSGVSPPGVPLSDMVELPGTAVIEDGCLTPSDAPGFGIEANRSWLERVTV